MIAVIAIPISEASVQAEVDFTYERGRPAYTYTNDPPEPPEIEIDGVLIQKHDKTWERAPQWLIDLMVDDDAVMNQLFVEAEDYGP